MGSIRKTMAVMLAALALAAFMSDADAQTRRSSDVKKSTPARQSTSRSSSSQTRQSSQTRRPSSASQTRKARDNNRKTAVTRQSAKPAAPERKPSTTVTKPSQQTRPVTTRPVQTRPSQQKPSAVKKDKAPDFKPGDQNKPVQVTRPAPNRPTGNNSANRPSVRPDAGPGNAPGRPNDRPNDRPEMRPGGPDHGRPDHDRPDHRHDRPRVHPRDRDFMRWDRPSYFWSHHDHCYGHRVRVLPSHVHRHVYFGVTYYCYNDIWYRPYGGYYVVCRPPYGISLAADIIADMAWTAVRLSYYNTVVNTYSQINENNAYIAEQNAIIAQNNATIAAQNAAIAQNQELAQASYNLANDLGLIQSYASVSSEYFYQDGVFYAKDASGKYNTIVPPAGALVETLPEDYDMVILKDGKEYYKVDDTVFKVTLAEGKPYFEVLGQMYS